MNNETRAVEMNNETYDKIAGELRTLVPLKVWSEPITLDTEIYKDLKIYGDVLFDFLMWIEREFGMQITISGNDYAPPEGPFLGIFKALTGAASGSDRSYKSLKVRDVVQAVDAGGGQFN